MDFKMSPRRGLGDFMTTHFYQNVATPWLNLTRMRMFGSPLWRHISSTTLQSTCLKRKCNANFPYSKACGISKILWYNSLTKCHWLADGNGKPAEAFVHWLCGGFAMDSRN
jgi:hypothetical protein